MAVWADSARRLELDGHCLGVVRRISRGVEADPRSLSGRCSRSMRHLERAVLQAQGEGLGDGDVRCVVEGDRLVVPSTTSPKPAVVVSFRTYWFPK